MTSHRKTILYAFLFAGCITQAEAASRMGQLVFIFDSPRHYTYNLDKVTNTIILTMNNTTPAELASIDHYDESLIRRALIKDLGTAGTELKLTLKDRNITGTVTDFKEPFRIVIDLFDRNYEIEHDPITGLPVSTVVEGTSDTPNSKHRLMNPEQDSPSQAGQAQIQNNSTKNERRLLQPRAELYASPGELKTAMANVEPGVGPFWKQYPPYIYRIQTAPYNDDHSKAAWYKKHADKAMTSAEAMADYAAKLFDFGHENRALLAYQQVLYKDPSIFDQSAIHLWRFAEAHFGQGNLTLADGYYQALIAKHPESDLSKLARIRRMDIEAVRATNQSESDDFKRLYNAANAMQWSTTPEIQTQIAIRKAFWKSYSENNNPNTLTDESYIPVLEAPQEKEIMENLAKSEGQKTVFLASAILLNRALEPSTPWSKSTAKLATNFLERFSGKATEPYRSILADKIRAKLNLALQEGSQSGAHLRTIQTFKELPKTLSIVKDNPKTAWYLGESFRNLGQIDAAIPHYLAAAKLNEDDLIRFKSNFWVATSAGDARQDLRNVQKNPSRVSYLGQISRTADQNMMQIWEKLDEKSQNSILVGLKDELEESITSPVLLTSPPKILLATYTQALGTKISTEAGGKSDLSSTYSPSAGAINTLSNLASRFSQLGMQDSKRKSLSLLRYIKPASIQDTNAKQTWAKELVALAEDYRSDNLYLEAGKTYSFAGENAEGFDKRAESLYKGGLLLYRSGRRDEAISAFQKCSEDGDDRYYANLCTERLDRLND